MNELSEQLDRNGKGTEMNDQELIEELEKELNISRMASVVMDNTVEELEAKLTKAVEALRTIAGYTDLGHYGQGATQHTEAHIAYVALAELEGEG